ncbi:MAG: SDR family oxidoreductase [Candidatus Helarchaeota archaeon]
MKQTVLIIGASGFIGFSLFQYFSRDFNVIGTYYSNKTQNFIHLNILNQKELNEIITKYTPNIILLPAALPNVEYCEENFQACWAHNVEGPLNLIKNIKKLDIKLVYYSSDYIFDGKNGPYYETDTPNPISNYGKAKLETEKNIIDNLSNFLILRTTVVYGWERNRKNFIYRLIETTNRNEEIRVPSDQIGTPTYVEDLVKATFKLITVNQIGIFNVVGPKLISRYDFSLIAADVFNLNKDLIIPVLTKELKQKAKRPLNAGLKIDKLLKTIDIKMLSPYEGLKKMKLKIEGS